MTVYCGVDFHARQQTISYCDSADGEIHQCVLQHEGDQVREFYAQFQGEVIVGLEASGYSTWFEEMLESMHHVVWLGNPAEIRRKAPRRQKNDRRDADLILGLMLKGDFPRLHRFSAESRLVLRQLRYRHKLVKVRTIAKNSLQAISLNAGWTLKRGVLTKRGQERLRALELPPVLAQQRDEWLQMVAQLDQRLATIEAALEKVAAADQQIALLRTHPGIGLLTGLGLRHTLAPVARFSTTRKVVAYVGLDSMEDSSADRRQLGSISKEGSRLLRFLLNEAGQTACRQDPDLKRFYHRLVHRRNRPKAKVAVARKLLVRGFIMLRDQIDYAEFVRRGVAARSARKAHGPNVPVL
jgi:transposase